MLSESTVLFVGAGISKEAPSNLFSWWEYNRLIIEEIGIIGTERIGIENNIFSPDEVLEKVPVSTVSDFLFNYSAGKNYFPLLKILEGSHPNRNHKLLAWLAQEGKISGIITTNFDTLIEQAFDEADLSYSVYLYDEDYVETAHHSFPIYKIHGSVINTNTAIDTAQQKLKGLSQAKLQCLDRVFRQNHIIFIGFSGEDFSFGKNYLPIVSAEHGITWILNPRVGKSHSGLEWVECPDCCEDLSLHVRNAVREVQGFSLCIATIAEFCSYKGWYIHEANDHATYYDVSPMARDIVKEFLLGSCVTEWGCAGMCIELLRIVRGHREALKLALQLDSILSTWINSFDRSGEYILLPLVEQTVSDMLLDTQLLGAEYALEAAVIMPLCDTMADIFVNACMYQEATKYYYLSLRITNLRFWEHVLSNDDVGLKKAHGNMSTTKIRMGRMLLKMKRYESASRFFTEAIDDAILSRRFYNISAAFLCHIELDMALLLQNESIGHSQLSSFRTFDTLHLYADIWCAIRLTKKAGNSRSLVSAYYNMFFLFFQCEMIPQARLALHYMEHYARMTPELSVYLPVIYELISMIQQDIEQAKCFPTDLQYQEPQYDTTWELCRERDILSTGIGQKAYRLFCNGKLAEASSLLKEASDQYFISESGIDSTAYRESMYLSELFSYCFVKLEMHRLQIQTSEEIGIYLHRCLRFELELWQTEYLTETSAHLAWHYYTLEESEESLFYAELCLCFCDNPIAHGIILNSCAVAAGSCIDLGKVSDAIYYANLYLTLSDQFPQGADYNVKEYLYNWLHEQRSHIIE